MKKITFLFFLGCLLTIGFHTKIYAQTEVTVNSLEELLPYLKQSDVNVKLAAGTYTVDDEDIDNGIFSNPLFLFEGSNSFYDFTDVKIEINTTVLTKFGSVDVNEFQILGNENVLKNLTIEDIGTTAPKKRAQSIIMDGRDNRIEGFNLTLRGSYPYGYGDAFGKGGGSVINHRKHSGVLIRGLRNHLKDSNITSRSYGHIVFTQAASYPVIEGCNIEGEMRSTDDMLAEAGTGSPADNVDFMTFWGYKLPPGYMMSLQEGGIRAYNAGTTYIDGEEIKRGTDNPTILNCTIKNVRSGVALAHATGTIHVDGVKTIGCEQGYSIGSGTITNCSGDVAYGPLLSFAYSSDKNTNADITVLPSETYYNGSGTAAYIGGSAHNITLRGTDLNKDLKIQVGGDKNNVRLLGEASSQNPLTASSLELTNLTDFPVVLDPLSSSVVVNSCGGGAVLDNGENNMILDCDEESTFPDPNYLYFINNPRWNIKLSATGEDALQIVDDVTSGSNVEWKFTPTDDEDYYFIDCIGAGDKKRITGDGTSYPKMELASEIGDNAKWKFDAFDDSGIFFISNKNNERLRVNETTLDEKINFFPMPVKDVLNLKFKDVNEGQIKIYTLTGQIVFSEDIINNAQQIDLSHLSTGIYIVKITSDNKYFIKKIVKQ